MNERVAAMGNQVKSAFGKVKNTWTEQEPKRKKLILTVAIGLIVVAVGLVVVLNLVAGRYVTILDDLTRDESIQARAVLEEANIPSRLTDDFKLQVPKNRENQAVGELAKSDVLSTNLNLSIFEKGNGLTTSDAEKRQLTIYQSQEHLATIIKTYPSVSNAYVTLNLATDSNRVWDSSRSKSSGSVKVDLMPGAFLSAEQITGIQNLVGSAVGIAPEDVTVIDTVGNVLAAPGKQYDSVTSMLTQALQQLDLEGEWERDLNEKAAQILSLEYPEAEDYRVQANITLDFDAMTQELMTYIPLDGTTHGVLGYDETHAGLGVGQYADGIVGEDPNTDIPEYGDLNGDGELDTVDYDRIREYAVSYIKELRDKGGPTVKEGTIAVSVLGTLSNEKRQALRTLISAATGLPVENVAVEGVLDTAAPPPPVIGGDGNIIPGIPNNVMYIAAGALLLLIILLIVVLMLRSKAKKKRLAAEEAALLAEQEEAERIQREIEERKKQLKSAAVGDESENAITNEVRDFARANPEITATLLRNWLKEGDG